MILVTAVPFLADVIQQVRTTILVVPFAHRCAVRVYTVLVVVVVVGLTRVPERHCRPLARPDPTPLVFGVNVIQTDPVLSCV